MDHLRDVLKNRPTVTMSSHLRNGINSWIPLTSKQRCASFPVCIVISLSRIIQTRILSQTTSSFKILDEHGWTWMNPWISLKICGSYSIMYWSCDHVLIMWHVPGDFPGVSWHRIGTIPWNPNPGADPFHFQTLHAPLPIPGHVSRPRLGTMGTTKWSNWYCRWSPYENARFTMDNDAELAGVD